MLVRKKKDYDWEELPAGQNNRRKEKPKPDTLGEKIMFKGEESIIYNKFVTKIRDDGTIREQALLLQRMCMKHMSAVGQNFHKDVAKNFCVTSETNIVGILHLQKEN